MRDVAVVFELDQGTHDRGIVEFLRLADLVSAGNAGRVHVPDEGDEGPQRGDSYNFV